MRECFILPTLRCRSEINIMVDFHRIITQCYLLNDYIKPIVMVSRGTEEQSQGQQLHQYELIKKELLLGFVLELVYPIISSIFRFEKGCTIIIKRKIVDILVSCRSCIFIISALFLSRDTMVGIILSGKKTTP